MLTYEAAQECVNYNAIGKNYGGYSRWGGRGMYGTQMVEYRYIERTLPIDTFENKKKLPTW